ncbi:hypothetical protein MCUN1_001852 [Malassezia cuniculi]|uniref:Vacuolar protein sorting-associated protein 74 n=1 Tax=Malassezia cuniculi TaxID=948313 RepID=A0AAF0EVD8_9BASI|nr:hypothetical protein MCUN1_001852 [Malassezia cuniculi]
MSSGLQRRRGAARTDSDNGSVLSRHGSSASNVPEQHSGSGSVALVDPSDGHRVAYDPRDLGERDESDANPRLTLMEEILLLGLKDRQGYLSFWNDNISYTLRGCILLELAFRGRIGTARGADQRRFDAADRVIQVRNTKPTGEVLLDETLRLIRSASPAGIADWIDMLSGETWNVSRFNMQLRQVRERLAKGLVDKGVLRTEKRNFLLFDMPTHPVADAAPKDAVMRRVLAIVARGTSVHTESFYKEEAHGAAISLRATRTVCMLCAAYSADVLENTLQHLPYENRESAFQRASNILNEFGQWPMAPDTPCGGIPPHGTIQAMAARPVGAGPKKRSTDHVAADLALAVQKEAEAHTSIDFELIAGVLNVFSRMDTLV